MSIIKNNKNYGTKVILLGEPPVPPTPTLNYFYVEDISGAANTLSISKSSANAPTVEVFCSTDTVNWTNMGSTSTTAITATVPANGKLYLKANTNTWASSDDDYNTIKATDYYNLGGDILSLLYSDNFTGQTTFPAGSIRTFFSLFGGKFVNNTTLISANKLLLPPATVTRCYQFMFSGCKALVAVPALPATTLSSTCYAQMFYNCSSLTTAPVLPATTLVENCYVAIFNSCTNLKKVTTYAEDISASGCLISWLTGVSATGDFYNLGGATYTSGDNGIPTGWTVHTSL